MLRNHSTSIMTCPQVRVKDNISAVAKISRAILNNERRMCLLEYTSFRTTVKHPLSTFLGGVRDGEFGKALLYDPRNMISTI